MARIFISHSSANNDRAIELRDWLVANGWDDFFLDLDPVHGIVAGEKWKEALKEAAHRCEAVLALVSPEWLSRDWCRAELTSAELLGKKIFVLLIGSKNSELASSLKDAQYVDLINDPDAYTRLKEGLKRAGLDPTGFPFEQGRRPYPGFAPLEQEDAAIFFGRDAQIVRGLDKLRGLARGGVERVLFILGASGSGKSSFLRAGLLPRLKRDDAAWLPLPPIRPERAVLTGKFGLIEALHRMIAEAPLEKLDKDLPRSRAAIEEFVTTRANGLVEILDGLRQASRVVGLSGEEAEPPAIVIPIDQGEELFNEEGRNEDERFIEILAKILERDRRILVVVTMRTDSFPQVQNHPVLSTLPQDTFTLPRMPEGSYRTVIEGPAALVKPPLKIDPRLTEALLQDVSGQDALALLAFTLRHLYDRYRADNALTLDGYEKLGRLKGVIETAVREALADGAARGELPKDETAQLALIRMAFVPHLARVNAAGQFVRRVAGRAEIPAEARPLIDRFADARLLVKDRRTVGGDNGNQGQHAGAAEEIEVIEVAHESLLREWEDLNKALEEEKDFLKDKAQLERDLTDWQATPEARKKGALLSGNKLNHARDWLLQRPRDLTADERRFIQASADAETARRRWLRTAAAVAFVVITAAGALATWQWRTAASALEAEQSALADAEQERKRAESAAEEARSALQTAERNAAGGLAALSTIAKNDDDTLKSAKLALAAWPRTAATGSIQLQEVIANLSDATPRLFERQWLRRYDPNLLGARFSADGTRYAVQARGAQIIIADVATGRMIRTHDGYQAVAGFAFSPDGSWFAASSQNDDAAVLWGRFMDIEPARLEAGGGPVSSVAFSPDGSMIAVASVHGDISLWDPRDDSRPRNRFTIDSGGGLWHIAVSPDKRLLVSLSRDGDIRFWDMATGTAKGRLPEKLESIHPAALGYSPDGTVLFTVEAGRDRLLRLWNSATHEEHLAEDDLQLGGAEAFDFSPDGVEIAIGHPDGSISLIELHVGVAIGSPVALAPVGDAEGITSVAFSPDGKRLLTGGNDGIARLWSLAEHHEIARFDRNAAQVAAVAFLGGDRIAVGYVDGIVRSFDVETDPTVVWRQFGGGTVRVASISPDGAHAVVLTENSEILVYDTDTGTMTASISLPESFFGSVAVSPGASSVALASGDSIKIWGLPDTTEYIALPTSYRSSVATMVFSQDGTRLALGGGSRAWGFADVIDVAAGEFLLKVEGGGPGAVQSVTFSKDGSRVLLRRSLGDVRWYDIADTPAALPAGEPPSGSDLSRMTDLPLIGLESAQTLALSNDGSRAVGANGKVIHLWDTATGARIAQFSGHEEWVRGVVFGPTDDQLVAISNDGTVGIWNLAALPSGTVFDVVCTLLPDHDLESALAGYPIRINEPICTDGYDPPLPEWMNEGADQGSAGGDR